MKIPIIMVHGIGRLKKDPDWYFKSWKKYFKKRGFEPIFYNGTWHSHGFNSSDDTVLTNDSFSTLASMDVRDLACVPIMNKMSIYGRSKIRALDYYTTNSPFWRRWFSGPVNHLLWKLMAMDTLDFLGDILVYLNWEHYHPQCSSNPIQDSVRSAVLQAAEDFPDRPIHVVSHSLGTKIVWDVLSDLVLPQGRIGVLMTLGSPLQVLKMFGWYRRGDFLSYNKFQSVDHWLNVYDVRDPVGAPIGGPSFKRPDGKYMTWDDIMGAKDLYPCANVCTDIGLLPWTAHIKCFKSRRVLKLFDKYIQKYMGEGEQSEP